MKVTTKGQITLNKSLRKQMDIHPGDEVTVNPKTHQIIKVPTRKQWQTVLSQIPTVPLSKLNTKLRHNHGTNR